MESSLFVNTVHTCFESVLAMDNAGMVAMFESLVATGLKGFLGCPAVIHETALLEFFENGSVRDGLVVSTVNGVTVEISEQLLAETFELPVEGLTNLSEIPKDIVFDARSIVSLSGEPVSTSGKKREMKIEFRLLCDILAKTISVKAGSFGAITQEKFLMMAAITCGASQGLCHPNQSSTEECSKLGTGRILGFSFFKNPNRENSASIYALNDKVGGEEVADVPRVKRTPVKKAVPKKRPAVATAAEPVGKKKRTSKSKSISAQDNLAIFPVAQEAVPIQIIEPTPAAPAEQPPVPKRKIQKRKRRLVLGSDDETVEQPAAEVASKTTVGEPAVEVAGDTVVEESAVANVLEEHKRKTVVDDFVAVPEETVVENIAEPVSEPAVADVANAGISTADDVDIIIEQVLAEIAQIGPDEEEKDVGGLDVAGTAVSESGVGEQAAPRVDELEQWLNLSYEEFHSCDADQPVVTASDTDEEMEIVDVGTGVEEMETEAVEQSADEAMSLEDIFMTIPVECPLTSANVEITKITLGKSISIPGVHEGDWYKAGLPKIPATDKGKAPLQERDPVKGNPVKEQFSLIVADIDLLVQLQEQIIDEVDKFFNSFSLKKLANLKIDESYFDKEALILSWAETDSTIVALNRRMYILTKYRELLIRKFLEARMINFVPGECSSATDLKVLEMLSDLHMFVVEDLKVQTMAHGLRWEKTCCSKMFEGRPRDRGAVIARTNTNTRSTCWIRTMICVDEVWVIEPCGDHWVKRPQRCK
ncbi:hypothetical protein F511_36223 [Dorcoceras hygrometricum]|uniref:Dystroglycan-like n=1 Tax=Dorcoceras hygrometricum TaxID=472368 RepID=A0A2Z7CR01_9LAMI|nr:hypothetical protein F511_36223 [Dorcoceras hygrometricum]